MKKFAIIVALAIVGSFVFAEATVAAPAATDAKPAVTATAKPAATATAKPAAKKTAVKKSAAKPVLLTGTVSSVIAADAVNKTPEQLVVLGSDGKSLTVAVKASVKITGADGKAYALDKIVANAKVQLDYVMKGTEADAVSIKVI